MKVKTKFFLLHLLFLTTAFSGWSALVLPTVFHYPYPLSSSPGNGVSKYNITQSVTYQVEINFTLTHNSGSGDYYFKFARLNDRMPNSTLTQYTPPYQDSKLLFNNITGYSPTKIIMGHRDQFNNTYDSFNASLGINDKVSLSQKYIVKLNEIRFQNIEDTDIGLYDMSDEIFDLYSNNSENYYERDDLSLINKSNDIVEPSDNIVEKAEKIYDWVTNNLIYNGDLPAQEKGALWAYNNSEGDCSEYSSLMITLLRIQNIPARKVTGFLISNNPATRPKPNNTWNFHVSDTESDFLGHAWIEYYVPNIGWIAADPTWGTANYFNRIDFLRFNVNVGANFFIPPNGNSSEFLNPLFSFTPSNSFDFDYNIMIIVLESNLAPLESFPIVFFVFIGIGVAAVVITLILIFKRSGKKGIEYYEY